MPQHSLCRWLQQLLHKVLPGCMVIFCEVERRDSLMHLAPQPTCANGSFSGGMLKRGQQLCMGSHAPAAASSLWLHTETRRKC